VFQYGPQVIEFVELVVVEEPLELLVLELMILLEVELELELELKLLIGATGGHVTISKAG